MLLYVFGIEDVKSSSVYISEQYYCCIGPRRPGMLFLHLAMPVNVPLKGLHMAKNDCDDNLTRPHIQVKK